MQWVKREWIEFYRSVLEDYHQKHRYMYMSNSVDHNIFSVFRAWIRISKKTRIDGNLLKRNLDIRVDWSFTFRRTEFK